MYLSIYVYFGGGVRSQTQGRVCLVASWAHCCWGLSLSLSIFHLYFIFFPVLFSLFSWGLLLVILCLSSFFIFNFFPSAYFYYLHLFHVFYLYCCSLSVFSQLTWMSVFSQLTWMPIFLLNFVISRSLSLSPTTLSTSHSLYLALSLYISHTLSHAGRWVWGPRFAKKRAAGSGSTRVSHY